ncbi:ATP-dependent RNA helicase [Photobacterium aphoticum]|uniref:DEAD/DEAH box helicase n=1 Tax=Photobacterium aphoticum TaxID=754436 RepID=UPI000D1723BC|nr:DEAD/DEAH box helicase [Photobacterium aphoticum]PSU57971.1 ATP-dependent RNA helicase [Photobacterium aphoticum]
MSFASLGLCTPILEAVANQGYETPSPIQAQAIPAVLEGRDVMAAAQTGTGKTAGFTLPILERLTKGPKVRANQVRALILTPTRELAAQVGENVAIYSKRLPLSSAVIFGGVKINPQMMRMRQGADVLVATPGRLLDLYNQNAIKFNQLEVLVLDEADRMLDMGFIRDIKKILAILPPKRQNLLFSATFSEEIRELARELTNDPVEISVTPRNSTAKTVKQWVHPVDKSKKSALLTKLIQEKKWKQALVFTRTKHGANRLAAFLEARNITAAAIHGNKSQGARTKALANFKSGDIRILVATDIAARGIDIDQLPQVVNFDLPNVAEDYVHRIGRTGRAGAEGQAISLICAEEIKELNAIEQLIQQHLEREEVFGFIPTAKLPASLPIKPIKAKKPKKPKKDGAASEQAASNKPRQGQNQGQKAQGRKPQGQKPRGEGRGKFNRDENPREDRARDEQPRHNQGRTFNRDDKPREDRARDGQPRRNQGRTFNRDEKPREDRARDGQPRRNQGRTFNRDEKPREDRARDEQPRRNQGRTFNRDEKPRDGGNANRRFNKKPHGQRSQQKAPQSA